MGPAAASAPPPGGETVYYYPRLPWGYVTYAARLAPDGRLVALEQRLTDENTEKLKVGATAAASICRAAVRAHAPPAAERQGWTYPMRVRLCHGYPPPAGSWCEISPDGVLSEKYFIRGSELGPARTRAIPYTRGSRSGSP